MINVRRALGAIPIVGPALRSARDVLRGTAPAPIAPFATSDQYWEDRYALGGNSGSGSYNRLATFKAEFLNHFVSQHYIRSVVEFGCGDGAQLELAEYPSYVGIDVSRTVLSQVSKRFEGRQAYSFMHTSEWRPDIQADLGLSLDVIYHLVEDEIFEEYMHRLFDASKKSVIVYASNQEKDGTSTHVRHRRFSTWVEQNRPEFVFMNHVPNRYPFNRLNPDNTSFSDFWVFARSGY